MLGHFLSIDTCERRGAHVLLAMSGGVDSAVSALALVEAGFHVVGLTMKNYCYGDSYAAAPERSCCSLDAIDDARAVCQRVGVRHMVVSTEELFGREVYAEFLDEYRAGRTPNPCVRCNSIVRFDTLVEWANRMGFEYVATGHYARVFQSETGLCYLARASNAAKDQSYFLSALNPAVLPRVLFPLGDRDKPSVREDAHRAGLSVAEKPDSQEVCFVSTRTLREFLDGKVPLEPGNIETIDGDVIGRHDGLATYTVGQRRGLGVAAARPQYVIELDAGRNAVVLGDDSLLWKSELTCRLAWVDPSVGARSRPDTLTAQIRSRQSAQTIASVDLEGQAAHVVFESPQRAIAPGQTIAFYDSDVVVGSGVIERAGRALTASP